MRGRRRQKESVEIDVEVFYMVCDGCKKEAQQTNVQLTYAHLGQRDIDYKGWSSIRKPTLPGIDTGTDYVNLDICPECSSKLPF